MDGIEDPMACRVGTGKGKGKAKIVDGVDGTGGGSVVGISSRLLGSVAITHYMWVKKEKTETRWTLNDEFSVPILNPEYPTSLNK